MNIEELRDFCLSLPDVTEATPFGKFLKGRFTILVFYVGSRARMRRMFCYFNIDDFTGVTLKCQPERIAELKERYAAVGEPFNGNRKHWISVCLNEDLSDEQVRELVRNSYGMVKKG